MINLKRYYWVYAAIFLVLISSCSIKGGIKSLTNTSMANTEVNLTKGMHSFSTVSEKSCASFLDLDTATIQNSSLNWDLILPVILLATALLGLLYLSFGFSKAVHPIYARGIKMRFCIPLFLEYQKITIYC